MKKILFCLLCLLFSQSAFPATALIENYTPEEFKNAIIKMSIRKGAEIKNATGYAVVTDIRGSFWSDLFFGSLFNPYTQLRLTYNFTGEGKNTIANVTAALITNPGSAYERPYPLDEKRNANIAGYVQKAFNGYYGYGFQYKKHKTYAEVKEIDVNNKELLYEDKIISVNGKNIKNYSKKELQNVLECYQKDNEIKITIERNKEIKELSLKSYHIPPTITKEKL